jgi:hypothetical protein
MSTPSPTLPAADDLAAVVGAVPGVDELYPTAPVVVGIVKQAVGAITQKPAEREVVSFTESEDGVTASVAIGIADADAATEVCRRVYDTISEHFAASGDTAIAAIEVTVARIG